MQLKKIVDFSITDIQQAITLIAKKQGVIIRDLTQQELQEIFEKGFISVEMECLETTPIVENESKIIPFQFFIDMAGRVQGLSVFVKNIEETLLYNHFIPVLQKEKDKDLLIDYYKTKLTKFPEPGPKEIYGENWREKWDYLGTMFVSLGQRLLASLRVELKRNPKTIRGVKNYTKESIIKDFEGIKELGFSKRTEGPLAWAFLTRGSEDSFILGEKINKRMLPDMYKLRNVGKKSINEVEDFIMLYDL